MGRFVISSYRLAPDYAMTGHAHERPGLVAVLDGLLRVSGRAWHMEASAGHVMALPAGVVHQERAQGGARCVLVELGGSGPLDGFGTAARNHGMAQLGQMLPAARRLFQALHESKVAALELEADAAELFLGFQGFRDERATACEHPPWIGRVVEMLRSRWQDPPRLAELAGEVGVTEEHLARTFRTATGCTAGDYLRRQRLLKAAQKLRDSTLPLSAVAHWAGYADQSHMTRQFRRYLGLTPGVYRLRA